MKTNSSTALLKIYWAMMLKNEGRSQQGLTVTELLVAGFIGVIVILGGGYVLKITLDSDRVRAANATQRNIQNRALDFIANDLRRANRIENPSGRSCNGVTPVLSLRIPNPTNPSAFQIVDYSVATPAAPWPTANNSRAIYRCGPQIDSNGEYDFAATTTTEDLLVDQIANADPTGSGVCSNLTAASVASPFSNATTRGTSGLVVRSETTNPRSAQVLIAFQQNVGNGGAPGVNCVTNFVTARAIEAPSPTPTPTPTSPSPAPSPAPTPPAPAPAPAPSPAPTPPAPAPAPAPAPTPPAPAPAPAPVLPVTITPTILRNSNNGQATVTFTTASLSVLLNTPNAVSYRITCTGNACPKNSNQLDVPRPFDSQVQISGLFNGNKETTATFTVEALDSNGNPLRSSLPITINK